MLKKYDTVIIGSGISGLTSAILCAKKGLKTAVIEQASNMAPLFSGFTRKDVHFETGFHYTYGLGKGEIGDYYFKDLGLDIKSKLLNKTGYDKIVFPSGKSFEMVYGRNDLEKKLISCYPGEEKAIKEYFGKIYECYNKLPFLNIHKNSSFDINVSVSTPESVKDILDYYFKSDELKAILAAGFFLHGTSLDKISFGEQVCVSGGLYDSAYSIVGGGRAVVNAYKKVLQDLKVDIFLNTKALKIDLNDTKKTVRTKDDDFECDVCISTIHPKQFLNIAPEKVYRESYKSHIREKEETPGFFTVYARNNGKKVENTNIFALSDYNLNSFFDYNNENKSLHLNFSDTDPQAVNITCLVPSDINYWSQDKMEYKKQKEYFVNIIKRNLNDKLKDTAENLEFLDSSSPLTTKKYVGYTGSYALEHDMHKLMLFPMTKIKGLYLSGQSVITTGFLGAIITAYVIDKIMEKQNG